jgi:hypothetical protein
MRFYLAVKNCKLKYAMNKEMKSFYGLLICLILFLSCSSDEDSKFDPSSIIGTPSLIIGTWKPTKEVDVCSTGSKVTRDYLTCEQKSRLTFYANGDYYYTEYSFENGNCFDSLNERGTWALNGDNLKITPTDEETQNPIIFELSNTILRIGFYNEDNKGSCDGGNTSSHNYHEFTKTHIE